MLRSGFFLSVSGPAALLTLLVQPMVQQAADGLAPTAAIAAPVTAGIAPAPIVSPALRIPTISPVHVASVQRSAPTAAPVPAKAGTATEMQPSVKPRRLMRDGCEGAISSLAGPEARRMVPGRCIA